ncbi:MarR family transcriptional regulator [Alginatibacterium sediminis]|uniref:MarR family transcriptional regulator n=2 Tax=Alginatibacterium sediminis TaxID=2164068 RepID=A0A420EE05_9ALTE|nr:MarR family transcriptional regulator [Alginatibacterium sediminis]
MNIRSKMIAEVKRQQVEFSPLEHIAMSYILETGASSQQMLVESMNKDKAQIARIVARLLAQDLIIKQENPADKRAVLLELSAKGKTLLQRLDDVEMEILTDMLQGFTQSESQSLQLLLDRVSKNLG